MCRQGEPTLVSSGKVLDSQLAVDIALLPAEAFRARRPIIAPLRSEPTLPAPDDVKLIPYVLLNGEVAIREGDTMRVLPKLCGLCLRQVPPCLTLIVRRALPAVVHRGSVT